jgi:CRISPR-associated protein Cmr5
MSQQRSLEQKRASDAWKCVSERVPKDHKEKYCQAAKGAMADIQINGLGQALAFWNAKRQKEAHYKDLLAHVSDWVMDQLHKPHDTPNALLDWVINSASTEEYRRATSEAMAFLAWLKRFAEAEQKEG